jgi:hypothetical protein
MRSTSAVSCVISQLEDIFRMHHPTRNSYSISHNEKCEKPQTEIFRRSHNVFPSPIIPCLDKIKKYFRIIGPYKDLHIEIYINLGPYEHNNQTSNKVNNAINNRKTN